MGFLPTFRETLLYLSLCLFEYNIHIVILCPICGTKFQENLGHFLNVFGNKEIATLDPNEFMGFCVNETD